MNLRPVIFAAAALALAIAAAPTARAQSQPAQTPAVESPWTRSIVTLEVARKQYDFLQPWNTRNRSAVKTGIVIGPREVLTTAAEMFDRTLVRLQKDGAGEWWVGEVTWVDYHANLALVTTEAAAFWEGLEPVELRTAAADAALQIARWRQGNLELRRAEFTCYVVREAELSGINHVMLACDSDIVGLNGGEPLIANGHCAGLVTTQSGRACTVTPASLIRSILEARRQGAYRGLGYFHWFWQPAVNLDSLARLKLPGRPRGVIVIEVPERPDGAPTVMKVGDIILSIDGFEVDTSGNYRDPEFGRILIENLSTRGKWAGDESRLRVWRDGQELEVAYRLPKHEFTNALVPAARYDTPPEYLIVGGLVFVPLTDEFLQSWGPEWKRKAPFRLLYHRNQPRTREQPALILLSQMLPDPYNIGYQDQRLLVVQKVNGQPISRLSQIQQALQQPVQGYHQFEFMPGDAIKRLVVKAGEEETEATARVLKRYGIREARRLAD